MSIYFTLTFFRQEDLRQLNISRVNEECKTGRMLELSLKLFNLVYQDIIFVSKLHLLTVSTASWYFGIRLFWTRPLNSAIYNLIGAYLTLLFLVLYDKAFSIPEKMGQFKQEILVLSSQLPFSLERHFMSRRIKSIPIVGIRVGNFNTMERQSTPIFIDFITRSICTLLIACR